MKIAVLGVGRVGSTVGRLWHAARHDVTSTARHPTAGAGRRPGRVRARGSVAEAVAAVDVVLVAVPGPAVKHLSPEMKDNGPA